MFNFRLGRKRPEIKQWVIYSIGTGVAVALIVQYGNMLLMSRHGEFLRDAICQTSKVLPDSALSRLMSTLCRSMKDGRIDEAEAKKMLGRGQQLTGVGGEFFDNDRENTDLRAEDEVDYAIERWERLNPSPKIDEKLRKELPQLDDIQLCVLSQAERYTDGDAIGIRYAGMSVCEVKSP